MNPNIKFFKAHLRSIIVLIVYGLLWCNWLWIDYKQQRYADSMHGNVGPSVGEGIVYGYLVLCLIGLTFTIIMLVMTFIGKGQRAYYLFTSLLFALPVIILIINFANSLV